MSDQPQETMLQFVVRKLNDKAYNLAEMSRRTGITKANISLIASGKTPDPLFSTIEKMHRYFKDLEK